MTPRPRLKVLLVVRWPVGGIRTYLKYVYGQMNPDRYEISVIAASTEETSSLLEDMRAHSIRHREIPEGSGPLEWTRLIWTELRNSRPDIVHSHGFTAGLLSLVPARLMRIWHLCTVHDVLLARQLTGFSGRGRLALMRGLLPHVDVVQTVGRDATQNLLEYVPQLARRPGKVATIRNGIRSEQFARVVRRDLRAELGISPTAFVIGFFGRFMSQKGFRYLVDAVERLARNPSANLTPVVVACGGGGFIREERAAIEKRGLGSHFRFIPFVKDVGPSLLGVDVVAIPSLWEACPLLPMEALACGVPVIGSDCLGLREVLEDTPATVVRTADAEALAEAIRAQAANPDRSARAAQFAPVARQRFDSQNTVSQLESLFWADRAAS